MKKVTTPVYDLIPPQDMIQFMLKYSFFHKQVTQIPESILVTEALDFAVMEQAFNLEIERNDCLRLRFFKEKGKIKQYFLPKFELHDIPVLHFASRAEMEARFNADAQTPVRMLKDETYRVTFFTVENTDAPKQYGIFICIHHLVMDNAACLVFFNDLLAVYRHLKDGKPMPKPLGKFEDRIQRELAYAADPENSRREEAAYTEYITKDGEPLYLGVEGPKLLEAERAKKKDPTIMAPSLFDPIHDRAAFTKHTVPPEISEKLVAFMEENEVGGECLVQLGMRLHIAKINNRHTDTYFITLCPRRRTLEEKRSGGSVTAPLPWRVTLTEDMTFREALGKMKEAQVWAFRHMDYPYMEYRDLQRKLFNYPAAAGASTMMFSWLPLAENTLGDWEYEFIGYGLGRYVMVLYTFAFQDPSTGCLKMTYQHRTHFVSVEDIDALQAGTVKALQLGTDNPDLTVGEILDQI